MNSNKVTERNSKFPDSVTRQFIFLQKNIVFEGETKNAIQELDLR